MKNERKNELANSAIDYVRSLDSSLKLDDLSKIFSSAYGKIVKAKKIEKIKKENEEEDF